MHAYYFTVNWNIYFEIERILHPYTILSIVSEPLSYLIIPHSILSTNLHLSFPGMPSEHLPFPSLHISEYKHICHMQSLRRPHSQRIVRVRTGCWTCRRRKKKCDEARPKCGGCTRNKLSCSWPRSVPNRQSQEVLNDGAEWETSEREGYRSCEEEDGNDGHRDMQEEHGSPESAPRRDSRPIRSSHSPSNSTASVSLSTLPCLEQALDIGSGDVDDRETMPVIPTNEQSSHERGVLAEMALGSPIPQTISLLPGYSHDSYQLLSHYLATTADCMANGSTPINPFLVQIVPLAFTSDLVLQLVLTQSAAHRAFRRRDEVDTIAQGHYTKALQLFRKGVTGFIDGKESNPLLLTVGALVMCFTEVCLVLGPAIYRLLTELVDCQRGHEWHYL